MGTELVASPQGLGISSTPATIAQCEERLRPVGQKTGTAELLACLTLVAPAGMTADDRAAWVAVARETLKGIPEDLLKRGCHKARTTCDHPSKIVPTIMKAVERTWLARKADLREAQARLERQPEQKVDMIEAKDIAGIIKSLPAPEGEK